MITSLSKEIIALSPVVVLQDNSAGKIGLFFKLKVVSYKMMKSTKNKKKNSTEHYFS